MKKTNRTYKTNPEPYEDRLRLEKLDPYEALIKLNVPLEETKKSIE